MAYNKQTWVDYPNLSSPITADRLNHMEDGIEEAYNHGGGGGGVTVGTILPYSGSTIPNGFMLCDGSAISRTTYAELFSIIGTTYGAGDGSTTFNIPDLKGRVGVGIDSNDTDFDTLGETGGSKELQEHSHTITGKGNTASVGSGSYTSAVISSGSITTGTAGTGDSGNLQPYVVINYIIRVTEVQAGEVASETLPVGSEMDFDGDTVPSGWEQVTNPESYSTTEVKTNKVWVNNKPIYRKCASLDNYGTLQQDATISFPISNLDEVIWFNLRYYYASGSQYFNMPLVESTGNTLTCNYDKANGYFKFAGKGSWSGSGRPMAIIVEYTKTTD